uniref:Uncharacterized protein n=1 Tax=Kwoniella pini CBS 10737 TaxID=1296096 RepID=A0A1B9I756_9TREE|nr:uncharacterized protein I206_02076 [Kwoniella pini CBS 10737]OCF51362.1 hypothetical protein I206_02076 [Kwoniella pini CBS 10737]
MRTKTLLQRNDRYLRRRLSALPLELQIIILDFFIFSSFDNLKLGTLLNDECHSRYGKTLYRYMKFEQRHPKAGYAYRKILFPHVKVSDEQGATILEETSSINPSGRFCIKLSSGKLFRARKLDCRIREKMLKRWLTTLGYAHTITLQDEYSLFSLADTLSLVKDDLPLDFLFRKVKSVILGPPCLDALHRINWRPIYSDQYSPLPGHNKPIGDALKYCFMPEHLCLRLPVNSHCDLDYSSILGWYPIHQWPLKSLSIHGIKSHVILAPNIPTLRFFLANHHGPDNLNEYSSRRSVDFGRLDPKARSGLRRSKKSPYSTRVKVILVSAVVNDIVGEVVTPKGESELTAGKQTPKLD